MLRDLRHALRQLSRQPGFSAIAVLTLALGIGATTTIFSLTDAVLLRRMPFAGAGRLAVVWETDRHTGTVREPASWPDFLDYRQRAREAETIAAFMGTEVNYVPEDGDPIRLRAVAATHEFLPMLGAHPIAGRGFTADETRSGGDAVVLLSRQLWIASFGRDPSIVGRRIRIDDRSHLVIGMMGTDAGFGLFQVLRAADYARSFADRGARASIDLWLPLQASAETLPRSTHPLFMVARLGDGLAAAQAELGGIAADLERAYPENDARGVHVEALTDIVFGPVRTPLLLLLAAGGLVLLVACANVANLLLARATARRQEVGVRVAMGASVGRLARQFAIEGLVLSLAGAALGAGFALAGVATLVAGAPPEIPRIADVAVDLRVLAATLALSVLVGVGVGLVPLFQARRADVQQALRSDGNYGASPGRGRLRSALVVSEVALAVVLLIGSALLLRSFWRVLDVEPGFRAAGVLKAEYQLPRARYPVNFNRFPDFAEMHAFTEGLLRRVSAIPGAEAAAVAGNHPLDPGSTNSFTIVGREAEAREWPEISVRRVTAGYFAVMNVPLTRGRSFTTTDGTHDPPVAIVNEAAVRRFFPDREPLGQQIRFWGASRRIVGVVADERFRGLTEPAPLAVYAPLAQAPSANGAGVLLVRAAGDPAGLTGAVRAAIAEQDRGLAVFGLEPMADTVQRSVAARRFTMVVLGLLAAAALLLAAAGVYGVLSYVLSQRTREIGIRVALGASPASVRRLVLKDGMVLTLAGGAVGLLCAWALTRFLRTLLFGVSETDPAAFLAVPLLLALVALAATWIPARRAAKVDAVGLFR